MTAQHSNPSGLSTEHRIQSRDLAVRAARLGLARAATLTYTQGGSRWDGINKNLKAANGDCPHYADCSAFVTWCLWNGLSHFKVGDIVNGASWKAGYTGTLINHGYHVQPGHLLRGDAILYGDPFGRTGHTALYVGGGMVISFGGEPGPRFLPVEYRPITARRRYI